MAKKHSSYHQYISKAMQTHKPRTRAEARAVLKRAAADWREHSSKFTRSNPSDRDMVKVAVIGVLVLAVAKRIGIL